MTEQAGAQRDADGQGDADLQPTTAPHPAGSPAPRLRLLGADGPGCVGDVCAVPGAVSQQH